MGGDFLSENLAVRYDSICTAGCTDHVESATATFNGSLKGGGSISGARALAMALDADGNVLLAGFAGAAAQQITPKFGPLDDPDDDQVDAPVDLCPGTAPAAIVDASGCSALQVDQDLDTIINNDLVQFNGMLQRRNLPRLIS